MNKKVWVYLVIALIFTFIGFIIYDVAINKESSTLPAAETADSSKIADNWYIADDFAPQIGKLRTIATNPSGCIIIGGERFVAKYNSDFKPDWSLPAKNTVTSLAMSGDTIFASTEQTVLIISPDGKLINELGPFGDSSVFVSVSVNKSLVAVSDIQNKLIYITDKKGNLLRQIGNTGEPFIIPSFYFEVELREDNMINVSNAGKNRIELRSLDGTIVKSIGEPGSAPGDFCGCCNPSHFTSVPGGFVTAEKGINRIKIIDADGKFVELVNSVNRFIPSLPLDVASPDGKVIYAANPGDSKVYVFKRKG